MQRRERMVMHEIVGAAGLAVQDGTVGRLVLTTLGMEVFPMLRYLTGDRARFATERCRCGGVTRRLLDVRRITGPIDIAIADELLFSIAELIDYRMHSSNGRITLTAYGLVGLQETALQARLEQYLPEAKVTCITATPEMQPCYCGKRTVIGQ